MNECSRRNNVGADKLAAAGVSRMRFSIQALLAGALLSMVAPASRGQNVTVERQPTTQQGPASQPAPAAGAARGPIVYRFAVHPGRVPSPALKYELLAKDQDRTQGNAATAWMLAFEQLANVPASTFISSEPQPGPDGTTDKLFFYLDLPPEQFAARKQAVDKFLDALGEVFRAADVAARRDQCDWGLPLHEEGFDLLLPHLTPARKLANLLAIRARYQVATGDWDGAVHSMQTGFSLACDLNHQGLLVQNLVGMAIGAQLMKVVREWQQANAPDFYWALAGLPRPFSDFRNAMQLERSSLVSTFPQLRKLNDGRFSEQDWQEFQERMNHYLSPSGMDTNSGLASVAMAVYLYPKAKQYLLDQGVTPAKIEAMPARQALAEYEFGEYQRWSDDMMKWANLPFWQAWDGMIRTEDAFRHANPNVNPLLALVPAVRRAYLSAAKLDRQIAAAQTIEALRAYAASHAGKVPGQLQELMDMPAPLDPVTGRAFEYRVEPTPDGSEARITIDCPVPPGAVPGDASRYEVTFLKS